MAEETPIPAGNTTQQEATPTAVEKTFTQAELDSIVGERLAREKASPVASPKPT